MSTSNLNVNNCKTSCCIFNYFTLTTYNPNPPRLWSRFGYVCPCSPNLSPCSSSLSNWVQSPSPSNTGNFISLSASADGTNAIAGSIGQIPAVSSTGLWYSSNSGQTWSQSDRPTGNFISLSSSSDGKYAIAGNGDIISTYHGIWYSSNSGATWTQSTIQTGTYAFISMSSSGQYAIAGSAQTTLSPSFLTGIRYSSDYGATWSVSVSTTSNEFTSVSISGDGTKAVAVRNTFLTNTEIWYSSDSGVTWTISFTLLLSSGFFSFVVISSDGTRAVAGGRGGAGLYYSQNGGQNWFQSNHLIDDFYSASISSNSMNVIAGGSSGIWYSNDGGQNWSQGYSNSNVVTVVISGDGSKALAVGSMGSIGILYSINGGETWAPTSTNTTGNYFSIVINNDGTKGVAGSGSQTGLWYSNCTQQACLTDYEKLDERRKAEILRYKANSSNITKKQQYANAASNRWLTGRKRSWATQTDTFTNPNTSTLQRVGDILLCKNNNVSCTLTSGANVPGKVRPLCYNPSVPLYNYKVTRTYKAGVGKYGLYGRVQKVSLSNFNNITKTINDIPFNLTPPTSNSLGAFTYTSSNASVATISGITVTIIGLGSCTITAIQAAYTGTQPPYSNYTSASIQAQLTVNKESPNLNNFNMPTPLTYQTDASFILTQPTSNSPGAFTYTSSNNLVATILGTTVTIVGASVILPSPSNGPCTITATQAETPTFMSGSISASLIVNKFTTLLGTFTILPTTATYQTNSTFAIASLPNTNRSPSLDNTPFTYASSDTSVATISGTTTTGNIVGAGSSTISATQAATANYTLGTTSINPLLTVNKFPTQLTFTTFPSSPKIVGDPDFSIVATSDRTLDSTPITYGSNDPLVATVGISTGVVSIVAAGSCTFTATQLGNSNYDAATTTSATLVVNGTTSTVFDWNSISTTSPGNQYTFTMSPVTYTVGNVLTITYNYSSGPPGSDTITGTVASIDTPNNTVTLNVTGKTYQTYSVISQIVTTPVDSSSTAGSPTNPIFILNTNTIVTPAPPTPPNIPANSIITNGECYLYSQSTVSTLPFYIEILGTSIVRPNSEVTNTQTDPNPLPPSIPTPFTFLNGCFVKDSQQVQIQANTSNLPVRFGFPQGGGVCQSRFLRVLGRLSSSLFIGNCVVKIQ